jgi:hypothetical protein
VNFVTKSGTKDFHGLASYFKRHEQFNANDFFNNRLRPAEAALPLQHLELQHRRADRAARRE